ncbi:MAG: glycosyltransferase family 39 protein [Patescibacteria group bacterium]
MKHKIKFSLLIILIFGAILRFSYGNWDSYQSFHPDERNIAWAVTRISFFDQLNPKFFAYGGLPIYMYKALSNGVAFVTHDQSWTTEWGKISVIGRFVSAFLSTLSIILLYKVGKKYFSENIGLLGAILLTFAPWAIREAHFATTETMLVFFLLTIYLLTFRYIHSATGKNAALIGIVSGLAVGAKTISVLFLVIPLTAIMLKALSKQRSKQFTLPFGLAQGGHFALCTLHLILLIIFTALVAFTVSPYTVLDFSGFKESMIYESGVALGKFIVPYTMQFSGTKPYLYQIYTTLWQMGPVAILGLLGFILYTLRLLFIATYQMIGRRVTILKSTETLRIQWVFLSFPLLYFLYTGSWFAKFARYNVPLLPLLTLFSAWFIYYSINLLCDNRTKTLRIICLFVYLSICLFSLSWGIANWTIYTRPQTRIEASRWIYKNVPESALIYTEHWNDGLPIALPDEPLISFKRELLEVYLPDNDTKRTMYTTKLPKGDFIILSTRRIWDTMPNLEKKYPLTKRFYELLLSEKLGYTEVATFTSYPALFGFTLSDRPAEESIEVFDHPEVKIFQNTGKFSEEKITSLLNN